MPDMAPGAVGAAVGRVVLVAGATSASGLAACSALLAAGATVVAVGRDRAKLERTAAAVPGVQMRACDLTDESDVWALADQVHSDVGAIDGILHLVGGWRGGGGIAAQTESDYRVLEASLTSLRHVSRAFDADLRASQAGRLAIVSSTVVERPLAGGANYAAVKAASEAWSRSVAQGYAKDARDAGEPLRAASVIFRVKSLAGLEDTLAAAFVDLFAQDAGVVNDTVINLSS